MTTLILGLIVFLGIHSTRVFAEGLRSNLISRMGEMGFKGFYSVLSILGFVLIIYGYAEARTTPVLIWSPPVWTRHLAALLTIPAFVFLAAAYIPRNRIKAALKHPMVLGVKTWALAHLLANGMLADLLLFGSFLIWAVLSFRAAKQRDRIAATTQGESTTASTSMAATLVTIAAGLVAWLAFALYLHAAWIGVRPFG